MSIISFWIGVITFIFTIANFTYNFAFNTGYFDIDRVKILPDREHLKIIFNFMNATSSAVKITAIHFKNDNKVIPILDFDPDKFDESKRLEKAKQFDENRNRYSFQPNPYKIKPISLHPELKPTKPPIFISAGSTKEMKFYLDKKPSSVEFLFSRPVFIGTKFLLFPIFKRSVILNIDNQ